MDAEDLRSRTIADHRCRWIDMLPAPRTDAVRDLLLHWLDLYRENGHMIPRRDQLDPVAFPGALSRAYIYLRRDDGFFCQLAGEAVSANFEDRLKGKLLSEILSPDAHAKASLFMETCIQVPAIYRNLGIVYGDDHMRYPLGERIFLPIRGTESEVDCVVGVTEREALDPPPETSDRAFVAVAEGREIAAPPV